MNDTRHRLHSLETPCFPGPAAKSTMGFLWSHRKHRFTMPPLSKISFCMKLVLATWFLRPKLFFIRCESHSAVPALAPAHYSPLLLPRLTRVEVPASATIADKPQTDGLIQMLAVVRQSRPRLWRLLQPRLQLRERHLPAFLLNLCRLRLRQAHPLHRSSDGTPSKAVE